MIAGAKFTHYAVDDFITDDAASRLVAHANLGKLAAVWWRADQHVADVEESLPPVPTSDRKRYKTWKTAQQNAVAAWEAFQRELVRHEPPAQEDMFE